MSKWVEKETREHAPDAADTMWALISLGIGAAMIPKRESVWEDLDTGDTVTGTGDTDDEARRDALDKIKDEDR